MPSNIYPTAPLLCFSSSLWALLCARQDQVDQWPSGPDGPVRLRQWGGLRSLPTMPFLVRHLLLWAEMCSLFYDSSEHLTVEYYSTSMVRAPLMLATWWTYKSYQCNGSVQGFKDLPTIGSHITLSKTQMKRLLVVFPKRWKEMRRYLCVAVVHQLLYRLGDEDI